MERRKLKIKITESQLKRIVKSYNDEQLNEGFLSTIYGFVTDKIKKLIDLFNDKIIDKVEFKSELESTASEEELEKIDKEYSTFKEKLESMFGKEKNDGNIIDISSTSNYKNKNKKLTSNKYFILHHSAGGKTAQDVMNVLNRRSLGVQWIIDKEGIIYQTLPRGSKGAHVKGGMGPSDLNNSNSQGVEIVANDDNDVNKKQCVAALKLVKMLGYSQNQIYGHGEVQSNKQPTEGQKCKKYIKNNW